MSDLYRIIWESVSPIVKEKLLSGSAKVSTKGSVVYENGKILEHLPFEKISPVAGVISGDPISIFIKTANNIVSNVQLNNIQKDITQLLSLSKINIGLTICSSAIVVGGIIASTVYLSRKIDEIGNEIDSMYDYLKEFSKSEDMHKLLEYKGLIEIAAENLDISLDSEIDRNKISQLIVDIQKKRNTIINFANYRISNLSNSSSKEFSNSSYDFINNLLGIIPFGMNIEHCLVCKVADYKSKMSNDGNTSIPELINIENCMKKTFDSYNRLRYGIIKYSFQEKIKQIHGKQYCLEVPLETVKQNNIFNENDYLASLSQGVPVILDVTRKIGEKIYTR